VVDQIRCIGRDPDVISETVAHAHSLESSQLAALDVERHGLERDLARWNGEVRDLVQRIIPGDDETPSTARLALADLQERIRGAERRATEIREQEISLNRSIVDESEVTKSLAMFDPVWDSLTPREPRLAHVSRARITRS
jgi:site-specific DNA recombinase